MTTLRLGLAGYGLVGERHAAAIAATPGVELAVVAEPAQEAGTRAVAVGLSHRVSLEEALERDAVDGFILATPNALHVEQARACIMAGCPVLIEKPIATNAAEAHELVTEAERRGVSVLVGHHRRHNPIMQKARQIIEDGRIGEVRGVQATCWFYKPDAYFEAAPWRRQTGAGPIVVNLVHDVDLLRYLCGDVRSVRAIARPARRGGENEDLASALLDFESGAVGTISVSDSIVSPWSWEMTSGEYPIYPRTPASCYQLGGTHGALSLPDLKVWTHSDGQRDWWTPMTASSEIRENSDPLVNQIAHFAAVIQGQESPLVSGLEGARTLEVIEAIQRSASSGATVVLGSSKHKIAANSKNV